MAEKVKLNASNFFPNVDILLPYRPYNYKIKIKLDKEDIFSYSPLY